MKRLIGVLVVCFVCFWLHAVAAEVEWQEVSRGVVNVRTALVRDEKGTILIGTDASVYLTFDGGKTWKSILLVRGQNKKVNFLAWDPRDVNSVFSATGSGLFVSRDQGKHWARIFKGKNLFENECTSIAVVEKRILLGTSGGLFMSDDSGRSWHKAEGFPGNSKIVSIAYSAVNKGEVYVAATNGVYRFLADNKNWERVFVVSIRENEEEVEEGIENGDEEKDLSEIRYIIVDSSQGNRAYVATSKGIYVSNDKGKQWDKLSGYGLLSRSVGFLAVSEGDSLFAATNSGVFQYTSERWEELSLRLDCGKIESIAIERHGTIYAATDKGLFRRAVAARNGADKEGLVETYCKNEPGIREVQQAAIKYAEVEPEKIIRWRKQAARRALLPRLTIGMDRDIDRTTSKSIWGTCGTATTSGKEFIGSDDVTRYNNRNWGASLTWELGDLIWNDAQNSIDVRSRLMVQLRDDILDEVTKFYFERIRVKMELDSLAIEDRKKRYDKELRLQELTASLDALTGGYFSKHP